MAGRTYFFSVFAIMLLTSGLGYVADPRTVLEAIAATIRILAVVMMLILLVVAFATMFGPQEE